jgi:hypothetical protein
MTLDQFLTSLQHPETLQTIQFSDTINLIDQHYDFTPSAFQNGTHYNASGQNNGSCKILAFALLHQLSTEQALHCFGDFYRKDVVQHPDADDHQNIRNLIKHGCQGVRFENQALTLKQE